MRKRAAVTSVLSLLTVLALPGGPVLAAEDGDTVAEITQLLEWFLAPGNNPTAAAHQRFWADDVVYTRSTGLVRTKADIMAGFSGDQPPADEMRDGEWRAVTWQATPIADPGGS